MKIKPIISLGASLLLLPGVARGHTILVYLQAGQSNADGRAAKSDLPTSPVNLQQPQEDVQYYNDAGPLTTLRPGSSSFGPEITFGRSMADFHSASGTSIALIKYAKGGTSLQVDWKGGGTATNMGDGSEYVIFQNTVTAGLDALRSAHATATITIAGMIWMQGENDANTVVNSGNYQTNLTNFITDVRATYGAELPFIIGRLSSNQTAIDATNLQTIRTAQTNVANADPRTGLVDTDSFSVRSDNLHFNAAGQQALGFGFASQMQSIPEPGTVSFISFALGILLFRRRRQKAS